MADTWSDAEEDSSALHWDDIALAAASKDSANSAVNTNVLAVENSSSAA
jgi:hypothetical protein